MEELSYYLPEIIFGVLALAAVIWGVLLIRDLIRHSGGKTTCMHCKAAASRMETPPYLFLLPVSFGAKYEDPEAYLLSRMQPILNKDQIPTGRRACHVEVYQCGKCAGKQVVITDFLQVRENESPEGTYVFAYETFAPLLRRWEAMGKIRS